MLETLKEWFKLSYEIGHAAPSRLSLNFLNDGNIENQNSNDEFPVRVVRLVKDESELRFASFTFIPLKAFMCIQDFSNLAQDGAEVLSSVEQNNCRLRIAPARIAKDLIDRIR